MPAARLESARDIEHFLLPRRRGIAVKARLFENRLELVAEERSPLFAWISPRAACISSTSSTNAALKSCPCSQAYSCKRRWQKPWMVKIGA